MTRLGSHVRHGLTSLIVLAPSDATTEGIDEASRARPSKPFVTTRAGDEGVVAVGQLRDGTLHPRVFLSATSGKRLPDQLDSSTSWSRRDSAPVRALRRRE
jgi:hypothetical protein